MYHLVFLFSAVAVLCWIIWRRQLPPTRAYGSVDVIVPAYNEEDCIVQTVERLMPNPYFRKIIVVNDGSKDKTRELLDGLAEKYDRLVAVHQANSGKGGALMNGLTHVETPYVFLTDADTYLPSDGDDVGYLIAEMELGADAVGGVPASRLEGAGLLPHIRAAAKLPTIIIQRTFQQLIGGAPFLISGACGLFKAQMLRDVPFTDRTKVEDLDQTWTLISKGYKIKQNNRCFVYSEEPNSLVVEWKRWRRWIAGYAVCMRLHKHMLWSRYGLLTIIPVFLSSFIGVAGLALYLVPAIYDAAFAEIPNHLFPWPWIFALYLIGVLSAIHHKRPILVLLVPAALIYVLMSYAVWLIYGLPSIWTGKEPARDKPVRNAHVVA